MKTVTTSKLLLLSCIALCSVSYAKQLPTGSVTVKSKINRSEKEEVKNNEHNVPALGDKVIHKTLLVSEFETQTLDITIKNTTKAQATYQLEWYFFMEPVNAEDGKDPILFQSGSKEFTIDSLKTEKHMVTSKPTTLIERKENQIWPNGREVPLYKAKRGDRIEGYIVILKHGEHTLATKASPSKLKLKKFAEAIKSPPGEPTPPPDSWWRAEGEDELRKNNPKQWEKYQERQEMKRKQMQKKRKNKPEKSDT